MVEITWAGFDGVLGTSDDVTIDATTRSDGTYLAPSLPAGIYQVAVARASLPRGMTSLPVRVTLVAGQTNLNGDLALLQTANGTTGSTNPSPLAFTGASTRSLVGLGLVLLAVGLLLRRARRRGLRDSIEPEGFAERP